MTVIWGVLTVVTWLGTPKQEFAWAAISFVTGSLYLCLMLMSLHARAGFRDQLSARSGHALSMSTYDLELSDEINCRATILGEECTSRTAINEDLSWSYSEEMYQPHCNLEATKLCFSHYQACTVPSGPCFLLDPQVTPRPRQCVHSHVTPSPHLSKSLYKVWQNDCREMHGWIKIDWCEFTISREVGYTDIQGRGIRRNRRIS